MQKIATPQELQTGLLSILAYVQGSDKPERSKIAADLRELADRVAGKKVDILGIKPDHDGDWRDSVQRTRLYAKKLMDKGKLKDSPDLKKAWSSHKKLIGVIEGLDRKKAATDVTAAVPSQIKRLTRMVRNEGVEEKGHEVLVKFKTERDANKFEDRAKGALGLDDDDDDDDSKYDVWGTQDPKSGMYTIHISF